MKIFIESVSIFKDRSGVGQYTKRLVDAAAKLSPADEFTLFSFRFFTKPLPKSELKGANITYRFIRYMPGRVYNMLFRLGLRLPIDIFLRRRPDVIIYPNFTRWPVMNPKIKTVAIIHDLSFIHFPQFASPINRRDNEKSVPASIKKSSRIITVSESSKRQIIEHYGTPANKISVIYPAVNTSFFHRRPEDEVNQIRRRYKLPKKYILYAGTLEPRKNIVGLLKAYENLPDKLRNEYGLVLAGGKGWQDEEITNYIDKLVTEGFKIILTGYVPDIDLPAIYSGAAVFAWPSHYEGFGIPPLEAMACGVPVITSDNSSLPEVVGDAAIKIDAADTQALASSIEQVLTDKKLAKNLSQKGLAQAGKFSWDKSAQKLLDLLHEL